MFDLRAVISTGVFSPQLEGVCGLGVVDLAHLKLPMQELNANAASSSSYAPSNTWICPRKSPPRPISDVSPTPRLGVAEDMGEEHCYQGRYGSEDADGYWVRFGCLEVPEWVEVAIELKAETKGTL